MKKIISFILVVTLCLGLTSCQLQGCDFFNSLEFLQESIVGGVGESINIDNYIQADVKGLYSLESQNKKVAVVLNRNTIKLMGKGEANITAKQGNRQGTIKIYSDYKEPTSLSLHSTQNIFYDNYKPITFYAVLNEGANPNTKFKWLINGVEQLTESSSFTLGNPTEPANITVRVETQTLSAQQTAYYLTPYNGELILQNNQFSLTNETEQKLLVEWFVNSNLIETQYQINPTFTLNETNGGTYNIEARVNGQKTFLSTLKILNDITLNDLKLDYYSAYPHIYLSFSNVGDETTKISIIKNGISTQIDVNINDGKIDLTKHLSLTESFKIVSNDNVLEFDGLSTQALSYLEKSYVGGTYYMRSIDDIKSLFSYMIVFRGQRNGTTLKKSFYLGFEPQISLSNTVNLLFDSLNTTGSYSWGIDGSFVKGGVCNLTITFYNDNFPSDFETQTPVFPPLISPNFSEIGFSGELSVQNYPLSNEKISTSEELFFTLEKGFKPDLVPNSNAEKLFTKATQALKNILDNDMDSVEIASNIYDYVIYLTTYDTYSTLLEGDDVTAQIALAVKKGAYYIEGVLDTGFAVCDGIAKTYSLLCNMAGVKAIRVTGATMQDGKSQEHAWNKILIDGIWYICDATWDSYNCDINNLTYKICSKNYFLLGERNFYLKRYETGGDYPLASQFEYGYFEKNNRYIFDYQIQNELNKLESLIENSYNKAYKIGTQTIINPYFLLEISFSPSLKSTIVKSMANRFNKIETILSNTTLMLIVQ